MDRNKIAVISTGNGGQSMAAYLANRGCRVSLYARERERVDMFKDRRFVLGGRVSGEVELDLISCDMKSVIEDAFLIMVTTPAQYHPAVAAAMADCLEDGQIIVLNPGRTLGTYVFEHALEEYRCKAKPVLAETDTFVFTCRSREPGHPMIYEIKRGVRAAAHDPADTERVTQLLSDLFGDVRPAASVLETGLSNIGMIFHPLPILMNITRVEAKEDFLFYIEGISPLVADVLERMDRERVRVAEALGVKVPSAVEWLGERYGSTGNTLYERIQNTEAYKNVLAPTDIDTRYVFEDIQTGCVPVIHLSRKAGVRVPVIGSVINWASILYNRDFNRSGRNDQRINFDKLIDDMIAAGAIPALR